MSFKPWRDDLREAVTFLVLSIVLAYLGYRAMNWTWLHAHKPITADTIVFGCWGMSMLTLYYTKQAVKEAYYRFRGISTENKVTNNIQKILPEGWACQQKVLLPSGGDVDLLIRTTDELFVIEIKSATTTWGCDSFFRMKTGIGIHTKAKKAMQQVVRNASHFADQEPVAVLWLPLTKKFTQTRHNVLVIGGPQSYFLKIVQMH